MGVVEESRGQGSSAQCVADGDWRKLKCLSNLVQKEGAQFSTEHSSFSSTALLSDSQFLSSVYSDCNALSSVYSDCSALSSVYSDCSTLSSVYSDCSALSSVYYDCSALHPATASLFIPHAN